MRNLILDQYAQQPRLKRYFWNSLTAVSWFFWFYLWLPLLGAISILLSSQPGQATAASDSILALIHTLAQHSFMVITLITVFLIWSVFQWLGKKPRSQAMIKKQVQFIDSKTQIKQATHELPQRLKSSQNILVTHDETSGYILNVEAVDIAKIIDFKKVNVGNVTPINRPRPTLYGASAK